MPLESQTQARRVDPAWAWAPYEPDAKRPWNLSRAGHLFRRAAFGASWNQLERALADGPRATVGRLLEPGGEVDDFHRTYDKYESAAASGNGAGLPAWWLRRMMETPHPLVEKMTLFWHGHFAASRAKVESGRLMQQHIGSLRRHALGQYDALLADMALDPAVLVCLNAQSNRRSIPNENLARGLFERFGLGPGHFSESDIHEAARAFTGWFVLRNQLRFIDREHDPGEKNVLGNKGKWKADDVVRFVLDEPATPRLLVRKIYRLFVTETAEPGEELLEPLARSFSENYSVARLVERILRSNLFFSPAAYRTRIKSPVEFALGIVRPLEAMVATERLGHDLARLGQNLYDPPTIHGWPGGPHWINRATLVGRSNLARALLGGKEPYGGKLDPAAVAEKHGLSEPEAAGRFLVDLFLQGDVDDSVVDALLESAPGGDPQVRLRDLVHAIVTLPEFQLA